MYIKKIIISGFRSFHYEEIDHLSTGQNVIIGHNGSGKSNIVAALDFVLTRYYTRLTVEQAHMLLCQVNRKSSAAVVDATSGGATGDAPQPPQTQNGRHIAASVTIWFDNTDGRFPLKTTDVSIKRTLSIKSASISGGKGGAGQVMNQYHINDRATSYDEMQAMLESCGFSINNSYYLVKQGIIQEVMMSSAQYKLDILRAISGAKTFDEKKDKALALLAESENTIDALEQKVAAIREQLDIINLDSTMVEKFRTYTKVHRYLTAKLALEESKVVQREILAKEADQSLLIAQLDSHKQILAKAAETFAESDAKLRDVKQKIKTRQAEIDVKVVTLDEIMQQIAALKKSQQQNDDGDNDDDHDDDDGDSDDGDGDATGLPSQPERHNTQLHQMLAELTALEQEEQIVKRELDSAQQQQKQIHTLISINTECGGQAAERSANIAAIIARHQALLDSKQIIYEQFLLEKSSLEDKHKRYTMLLDENQSTVDSTKQELEHLKRQTDEQCAKMFSIKMECREMMNKINELQRRLLPEENEWKQLENKLDHITRQAAIGSKRIIERVLNGLRDRLKQMSSSSSSSSSSQSPSSSDSGGGGGGGGSGVGRSSWSFLSSSPSQSSSSSSSSSTNEPISTQERARLHRIINGYYGQLGDYIKLKLPQNVESQDDVNSGEQAYYNAVEALLQQKIFVHLVKDEWVALQLCAELKRANEFGNFQFVAINRLRSRAGGNGGGGGGGGGEPEDIGGPMDTDDAAADSDGGGGASGEDRELRGGSVVNHRNTYPLLSLLHEPISSMARIALEHYCANRYVCRSFQDATTLARTNVRCDFYTFSGELLERNGMVRVNKCGGGGGGGNDGSSSSSQYYKPLPTKLQLYHQWCAKRDTMDRAKQRIDALKEEYAQKCNTLMVMEREIVTNRDKCRELECAFTQQLDRATVLRTVNEIDSQLTEIKRQINSLHDTLDRLAEAKSFWEVAAERDDIDDVDDDNQRRRQRLDMLAEQIRQSALRHSEVMKKRALKSAQIDQLKAQILTLTKRRSRVELRVLNRRLAREKRERQATIEAELITKQCALEKMIDEANQHLLRLQTLEATIAKQYDEHKTLHGDALHTMEMYTKRLTLCRAELDSCRKKYETLRFDSEKYRITLITGNYDGVPQQYRSLATIAQLQSAVQRVTRELARLGQKGGINMDTLKRMEELNANLAHLLAEKRKDDGNLLAIRELIDTIELKKNEIILRTYKQVNVHFQRIFRRFVPHGSACIRFHQYAPSNSGHHHHNDDDNGGSSKNKTTQRRLQQSPDTSSSLSLSLNSEHSTQSQNSSLSSNTSTSTSKNDEISIRRKLSTISRGDQFYGIDILVSFTAGAQPDLELDTLSGGQKTLVSLAFIFALQQVDPTPFYIFDEVDQNLDSTHRVIVADMIRDMVVQSGKQFILTTFRVQLAEQADKWYAVRMSGGLSVVRECDRQQAMDFLTGAGGGGGTTPVTTATATNLGDDHDHDDDGFLLPSLPPSPSSRRPRRSQQVEHQMTDEPASISKSSTSASAPSSSSSSATSAIDADVDEEPSTDDDRGGDNRSLVSSSAATTTEADTSDESSTSPEV